MLLDDVGCIVGVLFPELPVMVVSVDLKHSDGKFVVEDKDLRLSLIVFRAVHDKGGRSCRFVRERCVAGQDHIGPP